MDLSNFGLQSFLSRFCLLPLVSLSPASLLRRMNAQGGAFAGSGGRDGGTPASGADGGTELLGLKRDAAAQSPS